MPVYAAGTGGFDLVAEPLTQVLAQAALLRPQQRVKVTRPFHGCTAGEGTTKVLRRYWREVRALLRQSASRRRAGHCRLDGGSLVGRLPEPTCRSADLQSISICRNRRGLRQFDVRGNRRDAIDAEILGSGFFSAFVASLRFAPLCVSVAPWPRCAESQACSLLAFPNPDALGNSGQSADYKSAIQQTASLRYDTAFTAVGT